MGHGGLGLGLGLAGWLVAGGVARGLGIRDLQAQALLHVQAPPQMQICS